MNRKLLVALCVAGLLRPVAAQTPAPAIERGDLERTIEVENAEREYLLHVPESYDGKQVVPLVIVLHGRTRDGRDAARMYGMSELSDRKGHHEQQGQATPHVPNPNTTLPSARTSHARMLFW